MNDLPAQRELSAKVLAVAIREMFPEALLIGGEGTSLGFYYDCVFPFAFQKNILPLLEERMTHLAKEKRTLQLIEMIPSNAAAYFRHNKQTLLEEKAAFANEPLLSLFKMGAFIDFWDSTKSLYKGDLGYFKLYDFSLDSRGVTRILGGVFEEKNASKEFLKNKELLRKQKESHVELGEELSLFSCVDEGLWQWHPKGEIVREQFLNFWKKELRAQNFQLLSSPAQYHPDKPSLDLTAAHLEYFLAEGASKLAECAYIYTPHPTHEESGGMCKTRGAFCDRAHIFCPENQLLKETLTTLQFLLKIPPFFKMEYKIALCLSHQKQPIAKRSEEILKQALEQCKLEYSIEKSREKSPGPALILKLQDNLGRSWDGPFLQIDTRYCVPLGNKALVTFSLFNTLERFMALLVERCRGVFPFWLAPEQVRILPVGEGVSEEARLLTKTLKESSYRVILDEQDAPLGKRIHAALEEHVPLIAVIGEKERKEGTVNLRIYPDENQVIVTRATFVEILAKLDGDRVF